MQPPPQPGKPEAAAPCLRHEFVPVKVTGMKKCEVCPGADSTHFYHPSPRN